jgi:peroxiredoxin
MKATKFLTVFILFSVQVWAQGEFTITPEKPEAGKEITITYKPSASVPAKIYAYEFRGVLQRPLDISSKRTAGKYVATIKPDTSATFVYFQITAGGALDNNKGEGYTIELYQNGKPRKNANIAKAYFYQYYAEAVGVSSDKEKALASYKQELSLYPENESVRLSILQLEMSLDAEKGKQLVHEEIARKKALGLTKEEDYSHLARLYSFLKDKEQVDKVTQEKKERFPDGMWLVQEELNKFSEEQDLNKKMSMLRELEEKAKTDPRYSRYKENKIYLRSDIFRTLTATKKWDLVEQYLNELELAHDKIKDGESREILGRIYNSLAWNMYEDGKNLDLAEKLAKVATEYEKMKIIQAEGKSENVLKALKDTYSMYADTYAAVLLKAGKYQEGFDIAKESVLDYSGGNYPDYNGIYAQLAEKVLNQNEYIPQLEQFVINGKSNEVIKEILNRNYKGVESFDVYYSKLGEQAKTKLKEDLLKKIESKPAPKFALSNLGGTQVSLDDLKGKTVVVDFWATWCGPCIASFPGMKMAQEKFKDDPNVKFVFINAWEDSKEVKKEVAEFIKKGDYPFDVLFDLDNKVIESYGVSGIPTKFIVDKNGAVRFTSVGFSGSAEKLVDEISIMIDLVK